MNIPQPGERYERYVRESHGFRFERRKVLQVSDGGILFEVEMEDAEGTTPDQGWNMDTSRTATLAEWNQWARLGRTMK